MTSEYGEFIAAKRPGMIESGIEPGADNGALFPFQQAIVRWAIRRGRAAIFADTGLGKTRMQIEWARQIGGPALIVAPLGVAQQTIAEAARVGVDVAFVSSAAEVGPGISITNYEKLHRFDPAAFRAVVLDESSILKSITGKTRDRLVRDWTAVPYRLACTATPAPNDLDELANHSEFLDVMSRRDMLATYFVHDDAGWRIKGHARDPFYRWLATWAVYIRTPSDIGFADDGFELPELRMSERQIAIDHKPDETLFPTLASGVVGRAKARRSSVSGRVAAAAELIRSTPGQWLIWCGLNAEQDAIAAALGDECVSIAGPDSDEAKIAREQAWREGRVRVLATKPSIFGFGMNWQHCSQMLFLGIGDSWEQYYQAIRRCWRFGQTRPVDVTVVTSEAEARVLENVRRKEVEAQRTAREVVARMAGFERAAIAEAAVAEDDYRTDEASGDGWRLLLGDCVERLAELETASIGLSVHSPPFAQLYTYSASARDMGNSRSYDEFIEHYRFAVRELLRVTKPGRRACVHVQQIAMTQVMQGIIAWRDFRADVVRLYMECGWIYHGEVVVDKDPQAQAIRTKSKTLLFVQKNKDSSWSIPAMADYILLFRAPGDNAEPILTDVTNEEWILWARPIWYGIRESATLQASVARAEKDEKHIAPLQLETIERCVRLWSNRGELVLDPMAGIGSTGYVALRNDREFIGIELKPEYWQQAAINLLNARTQMSLGLEDAAPPLLDRDVGAVA